MNNLINLETKENQIVVSSREVAENFGRQHKHIIETIENIIVENSALTEMFFETTYKAGTGKNYKMYLMNRDGFTLLVMGFTGKKAMEWKLKYIEAFNEMEKQIRLELPTDKVGVLKLIVDAIDETNDKVKDLKVEVDEKFNDMPLFNVECDEIIKSIKKKATYCLGGYHSPAYMDGSIRGKVYKDIHKQIQREFEVQSYKAINREHYPKVKEVISNYELPVVLNETVVRLNNQQSLNV